MNSIIFIVKSDYKLWFSDLLLKNTHFLRWLIICRLITLVKLYLPFSI
jgi:hypothetical protein